MILQFNIQNGMNQDMLEIQADLLTKRIELPVYADADPLKILTDVEDAISSLDLRAEELIECAAGEEGGGFFSSISTSEIVQLLAIPEPGAPKKRGRRPKQRQLGELPVKKARAADARWDDEEGQKRRRHVDPATCERDYSEDEIEFMKALNLYKKLNGRLFPTCSETLEVIRRLGYVKMPPVRDSALDEPAWAAADSWPAAEECREIACAFWPKDEVVTFTV